MANKEWYTADELTGISGLPTERSGVNRRANKEGWIRRQKANTKGVAYEFHISSFPKEVREHLIGSEGSTSTTTIDTELLAKIIEVVDLLLASKGRKISTKSKAKAITLLYKMSVLQGRVDARLIEETIDLIA